jgi:hypothetical protein
MMTTSALELLRDIEKRHEHMSRMADDLDWNGVRAEWNLAERQIKALQRFRLTDLTGADRTEAARLIRNQLALQQHISERARPWMDQVRPLLDCFKAHPIKPEAM